MEVMVGTFMFVVLTALCVFTILLSRENFFQKTYPFTVVFEDIMGLRDGDNVVVRGMTVTNAVANGSFETTAAGWTGDYTRVTGADTNVLHWAYIPDGTHAATLAAGSAITNTFTAQAGRYRLAFQYMAARSGTGGKRPCCSTGKRRRPSRPRPSTVG